MAFLYFLIAAAFIVLEYFISKWFFEAAEEKGYHDKKYFWICFWLGWVGWVWCAHCLTAGTPRRCVQTNSPNFKETLI